MHTLGGGWRDWIDLVAVPISVIDLDGRQVAGNRAYRDLFGLGDDIADLDVACLMPDADDAWVQEHRERMRAGEIREFTADRQFVRADGTSFVGRLIDRPVLRADGAVAGFLGVIVDVSDTYEAREERRATEAKYASVLNAQHELVCEWGVDGRITYSNRAYREFFGYDDAVVGADVGSLIPEQALAAHAELLALVAAGQAVARQLERTYDDGRTVEWSDSILPLPDGTTTIVSVGRDITHRKQVEAELAARRDEALEQAARRAQFAAVVSHELRNPLHAMLGLTELLADDPHQAGAQELSASLLRTTQRLSRLVDDLLELTRMESSRLVLHPEPVDLRRLCQDVISLARSSSEVPDRVRFSAWIADDVPSHVAADGTRLGQVLSNLAGNAARFTRRGSVSLTVRSDGDDDRGRPTIRFDVTDTGTGIDPMDQARIFEPFAQVGRPVDGGTGLGLAVVRQLVDALGGSISLTSALGAGSRFAVRLPLSPCPAPLEQSLAGEATDFAGRDVLVVDDDPTNRLVARRLLERLGVSVTDAADGPTALDLLAHERFDLVLLDHRMPGMDGLEVARRFRRSEPSGRRLPLIAVTASASVADRDTCLAAGMDDHLAKPVSLGRLRESLRRWLEPGPAPPGASGAPATEDLPVLDALVADVGDEHVVAELVRSVLDGLPDSAARLEHAVSVGDRVTARREAHTIKSNAALLGAARLAADAMATEHAAAGDEDLTAGCAALLQSISSATAGWQRWLEVHADP
jgi:PAS domain S-box-containing protein